MLKKLIQNHVEANIKVSSLCVLMYKKEGVYVEYSVKAVNLVFLGGFCSSCFRVIFILASSLMFPWSLLNFLKS